MRIGLLGSVQSTKVALDSLKRAGHAPVVVFTLPISKSDRHSDYVDLRGEEEVVEVSDTNTDRFARMVKGYGLDLLLIVGWSRMVSKAAYEAPTLGSIGYHPSALPANRGRAVISWTILQGVEETAGTLFWVNDEMDAGPILDQEKVFVDVQHETAVTLYDKHMTALQTMLLRSIDSVAVGNGKRVEQDESCATWCSQRVREDGKIDWTLPGCQIDRLVRASTHPYPGAYARVGWSEVTIWEAAVEYTLRYSGIPGQVQWVRDGKVGIMCGDGVSQLVVSVVECNSRLLRASAFFKVGMRCE